MSADRTTPAGPHIPALPAPRRLAVLLGIGAVLALSAWIVVRQLDVTLSQRLVDLAVYRDAGRSVLDGRGVYTYVGAAPQRLVFTYPPLSALLAVPLAWLPFTAAGWLWTVAELAETAVITYLGFRQVLPRFGRWWPLALGVLAGAVQQLLPFRDEIKFGQVDEIVVILCALDCLVARPRWPRGALIGVAAAIKLTPLVFVPYLFLTGRRRAAGVALVSFAGWELLAAAVIPHDSWRYWTDSIFHTGRLQANDGTSNQSLRGMLLRGYLPHEVFVVALVAAWLVVAVVGFGRARALAGRDALAGLAVTGLLAVLLSPVSWIHHLAWLPLVLGVLVADGRSPRRVAVAAAVYAWYVVKVPWIGRHLVHHAWPLWLARPVEDGFGILAIALVVTLPARTVTPLRNAPLSPAATSALDHLADPGHAGGEQTRAHVPARVDAGPDADLRGGS